MRTNKTNWPLRLLKLTLLAVVLYFVGKAIVRAIADISWADVAIRPGFIVLSVFFEMAARFFIGLLYALLLKYFQTPLGLGIAVAVSWISFLGKYVPGKVALLGSIVYLLSRFQVRRAIAAVIPILATIMTVTVAFLFSIPLIFSSLAGELALNPNLLVPFFILAGIVTVRPQLLIKPGNYLMSKLGYPPIEIDLTIKQILSSICVVVGQTVCAGISTWCFSNAFVPLGLETMPTVVAISALAGTLGLLALFSPAGLGVRDGVYFLLLGPMIGVKMAALVVVGLRLMQTMVDVAAAGLGGLLFKKRSKESVAE